MNRVIFHKWLVIVFRIGIGAIFVYSGIIKLADPIQFADSIDTFKILPITLINISAMALPPAEILAGVCMIIGWHHRPANLAILILIAIFIIALIQGLTRGLTIDCGCFGSGKPSALKTWISLGRDFLLFAAAIWTYRNNVASSLESSVYPKVV